MDQGASSYRRFLDGEEAAFDEIMDMLFRSLVFFIDRYVQDVHEAEDIAIETMTALVVHPRRYNFKVSLKTYLFMLGRNRALDHLRRLKRRNTTSVEEAPALSDERQTLEEMVLKEERKCMVNRALDKLPEAMRMAVHLIYFEDLSYEEAAKLMKMNRKQVDNLLYRAKKELRILLGREDVYL